MNIVASLLMVCATAFPGNQSTERKECARFVVECVKKYESANEGIYQASMCFAEKMSR